jgi:NTP pyrophosphatase (non-canonical NTP hydrolase)
MTKKEVLAKIQELRDLKITLPKDFERLNGMNIYEKIDERISNLEKNLDSADEDIMDLILKSHKVICKVKNMGEKEAFGNDPAIYYSLALSGEIGELANELTKTTRANGSADDKRKALEKELADIVIYSFILAYTTDINLYELVKKKTDIVSQRALDGYYGGPIRS